MIFICGRKVEKISLTSKVGLYVRPRSCRDALRVPVAVSPASWGGCFPAFPFFSKIKYAVFCSFCLRAKCVHIIGFLVRQKLRQVWDPVRTLLAPVKHIVETRKTSEHHRDHKARIFLHDYEGRPTEDKSICTHQAHHAGVFNLSFL